MSTVLLPLARRPAVPVAVRPAVHGRAAARPLEPTPGPPPLDPSAPVPDDPGPLDDPDLLPPAPVEPSLPTPAAPEPV